MAVSVIKDFYPGTTVNFKFTISLNAVVQDISSDTVTFRMKLKKNDTNANAVITASADVTTSGATGVAIFILTPTTTNVQAAEYYCDVEWVTSAAAEHVIYDKTVTVLERVSDA